MPLKRCADCGLDKDSDTEFYHSRRRVFLRRTRTHAVREEVSAYCKVCQGLRTNVPAAALSPGARAARNAAQARRAEARRSRLRAAGLPVVNPVAQAEAQRRYRATAAGSADAAKVDRMGKRLLRPGPWLDGWRAVLVHYGSACLACGATEDVHPDHILPILQGGDNWAGNLQPLCRSCNSRKQLQATDRRPDQGAAFAGWPRWESQGAGGRRPPLLVDAGDIGRCVGLDARLWPGATPVLTPPLAAAAAGDTEGGPTDGGPVHDDEFREDWDWTDTLAEEGEGS